MAQGMSELCQSSKQSGSPELSKVVTLASLLIIYLSGEIVHCPHTSDDQRSHYYPNNSFQSCVTTLCDHTQHINHI